MGTGAGVAIGASLIVSTAMLVGAAIIAPSIGPATA
jgi:hypothetical protein